MSAYANDPRVRRSFSNPSQFEVTLYNNGSRAVWQLSTGRWAAQVHPVDLQYKSFTTADEAIRSLIGDPR